MGFFNNLSCHIYCHMLANGELYYAAVTDLHYDINIEKIHHDLVD